MFAPQQQGDVLIEYTDVMPEGGHLVSPSRQGFIIAEGEATGHAHVLDAAGVLEVREVNGMLYARIGTEPVGLSHEEHARQTLEPNSVVRFRRVQEYDHFAEEARRVVD